MTKRTSPAFSASVGGPQLLPADQCHRVESPSLGEAFERWGHTHPYLAFLTQANSRKKRIAHPLCATEFDTSVEIDMVASGDVVATDIIFSGTLRINGEFRGNVCSAWGQSGILVIGETGSVNGNVQVTQLVCYGIVTGGIYARDSVTLHPKSRVTGDVRSDAVELLSGAVIQGRIRMKAGWNTAGLRDVAANDRVQFASTMSPTRYGRRSIAAKLNMKDG